MYGRYLNLQPTSCSVAAGESCFTPNAIKAILKPCAIAILAVAGCGSPFAVNEIRIKLINGGDLVCENPSAEILLDILKQQIDSPCSFFCLKTTEEEFLQGFLAPDGFVIEYREGSSGKLFRSSMFHSLDQALAIASSYASRDKRWESLTAWQQITF